MKNSTHKLNKTLAASYHLLRFIGANLFIILFGSTLTFLWREQERQALPLYSTHPNTMTSHGTTITLQSTQILLIALGVSVVILLVIPNLLIRKRQPRPVSHVIDITPPDQMQTRPNQPITGILSKKAATTEQLRPIFLDQFTPISKCLASTAVSSRQTGIQFHPSSEASTQELVLQATTTQNQSIGTPLQCVPATPFIQHVPATPLLCSSAQGGLLTRYNVTGLPRRIELRHAQQNTNPRQKALWESRAASQWRESYIL